MSVNKVSQTDGSLAPIAGATCYADNPIGSILPFGGATAPRGWFLCQGQSLLRTEYAELFAVIGTSFGSADSTHFNIPDLRGEFLRGAGTNSHSGQGNGGTVGQHQDGTEHTHAYAYSDNSFGVFASKKGSGFNATVDKVDSVVAQEVEYINTSSINKGDQSDYIALYTSRPTNTSVNYIIKAKSVALPTDFEVAIDGIQDNINKNGSKNILPFELNDLKILNTAGTWEANSYTYGGVTFVVNSDNTISTSGTSNARFGFTICLNYDARNMILSGCPQGGARATYSLQYSNYNDQSFADTGKGYTIPGTVNAGTWRVVIWIESGAVLNGLVFKPMVRLPSDKDSTYAPYAETNRELTEDTTGLVYSESKMGAVNYLRYNLNQLKALNTTGTWSNNVYTESDVSFTVNSDKSVTVTGQASATVNFKLTPATNGSSCLHDTGWFRFLMSNKVGSNSTFLMIIYSFDANNTKIFDTIFADPRGEDININLVPDRLYFGIRIYQGYNANGYTFKPMITAAGDPNGNYENYVPYRINNKELTESFYDNPWQFAGSGLTWATGFTYNAGGYQKIGNMVFFALRATVSSTASTGDIQVVSGLPKPFTTNNIFTFACHDSSGSGHVCFMQGSTGAINIRNKPNGGSVAMTGFYFSAY
jgi:microcystin-dependent protein